MIMLDEQEQAVTNSRDSSSPSGKNYTQRTS
jgi:hypothetical protein